MFNDPQPVNNQLEMYCMDDDDSPNFNGECFHVPTSNSSSDSGDSRRSDVHGDSWERYEWLMPKEEIMETSRDARYDQPLEIKTIFNRVEHPGYAFMSHSYPRPLFEGL